MGDRASADSLRWNPDLILDQRGADMGDLSGGASGLLMRGYKGKKTDRLVTRIDPGVVSLVAELRGHERQAAQEWGQWKTRVEDRKPLDAPPAAITLAMVCTRVRERRSRTKGSITTGVRLHQQGCRKSMPPFSPLR
jgi:hypothetical protein